jgi:Mrp family chromosome partitioning ATPase
VAAAGRGLRRWSNLTIVGAGTAPVHDLPAPLRISSPFPFVGRGTELEVLRTLLPRADGEGRRVVLLGGEPGSGKSRLVREFAAQAAREGALVLYGACDAVVHAPYGARSRRRSGGSRVCSIRSS